MIFSADRQDTYSSDRAFRVMMARLQRLVDGGDECSPGPVWDGAEWREALRRIGEVSLNERRSVREFILHKALPLLEELPSDEALTDDLRESRGPGPVVLLWEEEFGFEPEQAELAQFCGVPAMLCYIRWLEAARRLTIRLKQERAFAEAMARLLKLLRGPGGTAPTCPTWDVEKWRRSLAELFAAFPERRDAVREFVLSEALPLLPELLSDEALTRALREGGGPGPVVLLWEEEFGFEGKKAELVRFCGVPATLRYHTWLKVARLQTMRLEQERAREQAFAEAMARLLKLLRGPGGAGPTCPTWDVEKWRRSLAELIAAFPERRDAVREFVVSEALPLLPELRSDDAIANDLREGRGPAPLVMLWEETLALAERAQRSAKSQWAPPSLTFSLSQTFSLSDGVDWNQGIGGVCLSSSSWSVMTLPPLHEAPAMARYLSRLGRIGAALRQGVRPHTPRSGSVRRGGYRTAFPWSGQGGWGARRREGGRELGVDRCRAALHTGADCDRRHGDSHASSSGRLEFGESPVTRSAGYGAPLRRAAKALWGTLNNRGGMKSRLPAGLPPLS